MNTDTPQVKPPLWFWIVSAVALVWNLLGVGAYIHQAMTPYDGLVEAYGAAQADAIAAQPAWYTAVFALAVFGGALGCLGLLLRKKWALWLLLLSLFCVFLQQIYLFVLTSVGSQIRGGEWVMTILIPIVAILLFMLARKGIDKGWLR